MSEEAVTTEEATEEVVVEATTETEVTGTEESQPAFVDAMLESMTDEEVKGHKMWDNLKGKDADELGRYVKELKSFAGKKGDIPKVDATEEEWNDFHSKLGRPDSTDGYEFDLTDEFKEIVGEGSQPFYEQAIGWFKDEAFKAGMPPAKAEEMVDGYLNMIAASTQEGNKALEALTKTNDEALHNEWGTEYPGMMEGVKALLRTNGMSEGDISSAESSGVLKEPSLAIALGKIAARFEDDPEIGHHQTKTTAGLHDQLADVNAQVGAYIERGESTPSHLMQKRMDIMSKLGDNL